MRIFNEQKTEELNYYDLDFSKGCLLGDVLTTHIEYQPFIEEQGHYETIKEYDNGGKDVKYIVDVEGQEEVQEHDIEEEIYIYKPFTKEELEKVNAQNRIAELKQQIAKYKEDVEQVELFGMQRDDYAEKKELCKSIILQLREFEAQLKEEPNA